MKKVLTTEIRWGRNRGMEEHTEEKANDWIGKKVRIKSALRHPTISAVGPGGLVIGDMGTVQKAFGKRMDGMPDKFEIHDVRTDETWYVSSWDVEEVA